MTDGNSDAVYQQAVQKLRLLLSASETINMVVGEDISFAQEGYLPFAGSMEQLSSQHKEGFIANKQKFVKNPAWRKPLANRERHNSWHNLVHFESEEKSEELALLHKQERYISQLEKETSFCREQLTFVLQNVKDVLNENLAVKKSEEVNTAISSIFSTIQGWQNNINSTVAARSANDVNVFNFDKEGLSQELQAFGIDDAKLVENIYAKRLRSSNEALSQALKEMRSDLEDVRKREDEAAEQVKRSLQVAEQLRIEKSEVDYELSQLKLQLDRQQGRIRSLIENQVAKIEEERTLIERRCQEQIQLVREEAGKQLEEIGRMTSEIDHLQRIEGELTRQLIERDRIVDGLKQETERRVGQLQLEIVRLNSSRAELELENSNTRIELDHAQHELKSEISRRDVELKSVRGRLAKTEELLVHSRQEALELTEEKASMQQELSLAKLRQDNFIKKKGSLSVKEKEDNRQMQISKLEDMIRRQSHIIGELKHQCTLVTDRLEETARFYEKEKQSLVLKMELLESERNRCNRRCLEMESQLEVRGRIHEKLCVSLANMDKSYDKLNSELRQSYILSENLKQDNAAQDHEISFYKDMLTSRGLLPEKDAASIKTMNQRSNKTKRQAIVVQRNGEVFSPV